MPWLARDLGKVHLAIGPAHRGAFNLAAQPFGNPSDPFCWMINHVSQQRGGLSHGDVIITDSYCGLVEVCTPQYFVAAFANYGEVSLNVL